MAGAAEEAGGGQAEVGGNGAEVVLAVEVDVLGSVDDVEACDPEEDGAGQDERGGCEEGALGRGNGDPGGQGCEHEGGA